MQQWELCELRNGQWVQAKGGWLFDVAINYFAPTGDKHYVLAASAGKGAKAFAYDPYRRAISLLLAANWEPVSMTHPTRWNADTFNWNITVALFKRPVEPGRAVDEPKLVDLIQPSS
jgi:hypothetical protein